MSDEPESRKITGLILIPTLDYIRKTWGEDGLKECAKEVGINPGKIKDDLWYDWESTDRKLMNWIVNNKGAKYVERSAVHRLKKKSVLIHLVKFMDIKTVLKQFPKHYHNMYNFGDIKIVIDQMDEERRRYFGQPKEGKAFVKVDWPDDALDDFHNLNWIGAFKGLMDITRTNGSVEETKCKLEGHPYCEYTLEWK